ncbi:MAG: CcmD family protein [Bacteroidota bacterium]
MKKFLLTILACLPSLLIHAQSDPDFMRSTGKIYVVVAVIVAVFIGLVFFLLYLDRRLTKLENQTKD